MCSDYTKGAFSARARRNTELDELKTNLVQCLEGAAVSARCKCKITEMSHYKGILALPLFVIVDLKVNVPLADRYECYASRLGIKFPPRKEQEDLEASASTDQGNVSYEIPAIQAVYKIDVPSGDANHTVGFAEVSPNSPEQLTYQAAKSIQAHQRTILSSKVLAYVAVDYLRDPVYREKVKLYYNEP